MDTLLHPSSNLVFPNRLFYSESQRDILLTPNAMSISSLENYHVHRAQLIAEDTSLRSDRKKLASLTAAEASAEALIREIRKEEAEKVRGTITSVRALPSSLDLAY
jgi:hypothetical protein